MRILTATTTTPRTGRRTARPLDGEVVVMPLCCGAPDGVACSGVGTFVGVESGAETTAAVVAEIDVHPDEIVGHVEERLVRAGVPPGEATPAAGMLAWEMLAVAGRFAAGEVVGRVDDCVAHRPRSPTVRPALSA